MKKFYFSLLALLSLFIVFNAYSQSEESEKFNWPFNAGIYANLNLNMHSPDFTITNINVSGIEYQNKTFDKNSINLGGSFGFIGNYQLNHTFTLSGRIGYNLLNGVMEEHDTSSIKFHTSLGVLEISPILQVHNLISSMKNLYFLGGLEFGIPVSNLYEFETSKGTNSDPTFSNLSPRIALALGAGIVYNLSKTTYLTPELSFRIPLGSANKDQLVGGKYKINSWSISQLRLGVNLTFSFSKEKQEEQKETKGLSVGFDDVRGFDSKGESYHLEKIRVEDNQYTEVFPILPYIFCDEGKANPSTNDQILSGKNQAGEFKINKLPADAMQLNKRILDIVGTRMVKYPNINITITGTRDNKDEEKMKMLTEERANFAKNYLVNNFNIEQSRIKTIGGGLPAKPTNPSVPDGDAENRRIEITSDNPQLFEPIVIDKENKRIADPNLVEFIPFAKTSDSITSWEMTISQAGTDLYTYKNSGKVKPVQWSIYPNELQSKDLPVDYSLKVETLSGITKTAEGSIPVDYFSFSRKKLEELPDKTISKFSLVLFDFDKFNISNGDMEILNKYIIPAVKYNSEVKIYGYTDRIGTDSYNKSLADKRASSVKTALEDKIKTAKYETYPIGESTLIFDNDLPIGRQLSRTVQVYVITPK